MVTINVKMANTNNFGGFRNISDIKYIVIHYTANDGDTAEGNGNYFANNVVSASAHYFVDDDSIVQSVPDNRIAWSVGGNKYPNTKGAVYYGKCTNNNSISVELCDTKKNGVYDFTEATLKNAADLVRLLMKKYNVPADRVIRHYDVNGKICPKPFVENEKAWNDFKERLTDEMVKRYNTINEVPTWAKATIQKLVNEGKIADGNKLDMSEDMLRVLVIMNR